jgi:Rrf2 family protein
LDVNIRISGKSRIMLSQTVEYALRATVQLASILPSSSTTADLATVTRIPPAYLAKILQELVKAGIVVSRRGVNGGVTLARAADELTILDIVNATDPIPRIKVCPLDLKTHGATLCPLHRRLDGALAQVEEAFGTTTLAEVLGDSGKIKPLCEVSSRQRK